MGVWSEKDNNIKNMTSEFENITGKITENN